MDTNSFKRCEIIIFNGFNIGGNFMRTTFMANANNIERKWYVVDAEGQTLGRLASEVASILRGKNKPTFTPHVDTGDHVIIINASKIHLTGKKLTDKIYYRHTMHPGGLKQRTALEMRTNYSEKMLELAIKGMLPKNSLGRQIYKKLNVYAGSEHPHQAQKPEVYTLRG
ncbi:MAG: rplM [Neobacillus sp.]|jgi:large subunit ribosomal protein L13|nr:rplM [Neobacillus sp.]